MEAQNKSQPKARKNPLQVDFDHTTYKILTADLSERVEKVEVRQDHIDDRMIKIELSHSRNLGWIKGISALGTMLLMLLSYDANRLVNSNDEIKSAQDQKIEQLQSDRVQTLETEQKLSDQIQDVMFLLDKHLKEYPYFVCISYTSVKGVLIKFLGFS